jgi:hypothetical protein
VKQALFNAAVAESRRVRDAGGNLATVPLWNKLVFAKVGPCAPLETAVHHSLSIQFDGSLLMICNYICRDLL